MQESGELSPEALKARVAIVQQNRMSRPGLGEEFANTSLEELLECRRRLRTAETVCVVTGFYIRDGRPPAPETDGPTSSLNLCYNLLL